MQVAERNFFDLTKEIIFSASLCGVSYIPIKVEYPAPNLKIAFNDIFIFFR
jgi:hypothetical protein